MANPPRRPTAAPIRSARKPVRAAWEIENRDAIDDYNARVERHGVFSDEWRKF